MTSTKDICPLFPQPPEYTSADTQGEQREQGQNESKRLKIFEYDEPVTPVYYQRKDEARSFYTARIFVAGDVGVGKSTLMQAYMDYNESGKQRSRRVNACYMRMKGPYTMPFLLKLLHASIRGNIKELCQQQTLSVAEDWILLCFAKDNLESLLNIKNIWYPMLKLLVYSRKVPIILVGTKWDKVSHIPEGLVLQVAKEIDAIALIQSSSWENRHVRTVFDVPLQYLHEEWTSGLNKIYEKSLEPESFEKRVLKGEGLEIEFGRECQVFPKSQDQTKVDRLNSKLLEREKGFGKQHLTVNANREKPPINAQKRKNKDTCVVV